MKINLFVHESIWVHEQLKETQNLISQLQKQIAVVVDQSSESWHDNAPLDAIKHELEANKERQRWLSSMVPHRVIDYPEASGQAQVGNQVEILLGNKQIKLFIGNLNLNSHQLNHISQDSPLAKLIVGAQQNQEISHNQLNVKILQIKKHQHSPA